MSFLDYVLRFSSCEIKWIIALQAFDNENREVQFVKCVEYTAECGLICKAPF